MDLRFTVAIWMFIVIGYLQAKPFKSSRTFELLGKDVECGDHVNFTSPTNVKEHCHAAALDTIMEELKRAQTHCTLHNELRIKQALDNVTRIKKQVTEANSSDCKWEGSPKNFTDFLKDFKNLREKIHSVPPKAS